MRLNMQSVPDPHRRVVERKLRLYLPDGQNR